MLDLERPDRVGGHDVLLDELDLNDSVAFDAVLRPVHVTFSLQNDQNQNPTDGSLMKNKTYSSSLDQIRDHDDDHDSLLPDHAPEAVEGGGQRALSSDVRPRLLEAVDVVGVDVVDGLFLTRIRHEPHSTVVICKNPQTQIQFHLRVKHFKLFRLLFLILKRSKLIFVDFMASISVLLLFG